MQTQLADFIRATPEGLEAEAILRKCVHCGFCTATCPTYQLLGDDLDSPRGRIYLMKSALEGGPITERTRLHLDRCLTCRACETACPSGVKYGRLVDIGRNLVESRTTRSLWDRCERAVLGFVLPRTALFGAALRVGQLVRAVLPRALRAKVPPPASAPGTWPAPRHERRMLALAGCVQSVLAPSINAAAARVLDRLGISLVDAPDAGCCGALRFHLNYQRGGLDDMRRLIDAWWPFTEQKQTEAICMTASGCGVTVEEYAHHFAHDPDERVRAARISLLAKDVSEVIAAEAPALEKLLAADPRCRRRLAAEGRVRTHAGRRRAVVLRIRRDLFDPAARAVAATQSAQDHGARIGRARDDRHCEHRLPHAPAGRNREAGAALDRTAR